jgi:hypothetical protein
MRVSPNADLVEDLPGGVEQRMLGMGRRNGHLLGTDPFPSPTSLGTDLLLVGSPPTATASPLALGVRRTPLPEVVRGSTDEPAVSLPDLVAPPLGMPRPVTSLSLARVSTACVGIVAVAGASLVHGQAETVGEHPSARVTALSRHDLRQWSAPHGRTPVRQPRDGGRASSRSGRWGTLTSGRRSWQSRGGRRAIRCSLRTGSVGLVGVRTPADFPPTRLLAT